MSEEGQNLKAQVLDQLEKLFLNLPLTIFLLFLLLEYVNI